MREIRQGMDSLKQNVMESLILDLRGNGGGYMKAAEIVGETFDCGTSRVYRSTMVRSGAPK